jgi:hypothetical protein
VVEAGGGRDDARLVREALRREALRLNDRYVREVVLAFGLCPWADGVLRAGGLARHVLPGRDPAPADCLPIIDEWSGAGAAGGTPNEGDSGARACERGAPIGIGFIILPLRAGSSGSFDSFAEAVRRADRARRPRERPSPFVIAAFHPEGAQRFEGPHQLVSFLRRTPDPLLQLVRAELLDRVQTASPGVSEQIAARNFATLRDPAATARFDAVVRDIRADRDRTYAAISPSLPSLLNSSSLDPSGPTPSSG